MRRLFVTSAYEKEQIKTVVGEWWFTFIRAYALTQLYFDES